MKYDPMIFTIPESVSKDDFIICTYFAQGATADLLVKASSIAVEQTTGTWLPVPRETPEVRNRCVGRVIAVHEIPAYEFEMPEMAEAKERTFVFQIAFPYHNIGSNIAELISTVIGNISMAGKLKLIDIEFPKRFTEGFKGPKFGIDGIRKLLDVPKRPLLLSMIKPCTGVTPNDVYELIVELGMGGVDIVKDDELLGDPYFCSVKDRLPQGLKACKEVYERTGKKVLYAINITDRPEIMHKKAKWCIENGANCIMVNNHGTGPSAMQDLAEDPEINVPIVSHPCGAGVSYESHYSGMSSHLVLAKLPRLAGADIVVYPCSYGKTNILKERYIRVSQTLKSDFHHLKPVWPAPAAGMYTGLMSTIVNEHGSDVIIAAGAAMHGHPQGATAGTKALRDGIDAIMEGVSLEEAAKSSPELDVALKAWGTGSTTENKMFELKR